MQDVITEFLVAPLWAQIGMVLFTVMVVVSVIGPSVRRRRLRKQFGSIARELGKGLPASRDWPVVFAVTAEEREFEIRHDLRSRSRGGAYRGPTGHLLIVATRLAGTRWSMSQVDIQTMGRVGSWLARKVPGTGDAAFDARFRVVQDGLPPRDGWVDATTRQAITRFVDEVPLPGVIWIREGELLFTMEDPWKGIDGPAIRALLRQLGALASALDRTARGWA